MNYLKVKERFNDECYNYNFNYIGKSIMKIIREIESEDYMFFKFDVQEKGKYITERRFIGEYNYIKSQIYLQGKSVVFPIIMDRQTYIGLNDVVFKTCDELKKCLAENLVGKKHVILKPSCNVSARDFLNSFPYISEYLNTITKWRIDNETIEVPEDNLNEIINNIISSYKKEKAINKV